MNDLGAQVAQAAPSNLAASSSSQTGSQQATPPAGSIGNGAGGIATYTVPPPPPPPQNPYALADTMKLKGWILPIPGAADTLDQGFFGARNALAQEGISYFGFTSDTFEDNVLRHGHPPGVNSALLGNSKEEQYEGQLPTFSSTNAFFVNFDLGRFNIPDGQITLGGALVSTNWNPSLPNGFSLAQATYYQTLFDKRIELQIGYIQNAVEFLGTQVGGNLAGGIFGVGAAVSFENGESLYGLPTPGINVKVNFPDNFYTKLGVQRAISSGGPVVERLENPSSFRFGVADAGVFVIDELGYRVNAAPGQMGTWLRAAANYTSSSYSDLTNPTMKSDNYGLYLLADRQLIQTAPHAGPRSAFQGLYAGFSVEYGPPGVNAFTQYYEARLYGFGLIPGRPIDQLSLVANRNIFSGQAVSLARSFGVPAHNVADTFTAAYSAHVLPGVNLNFGVAYTDNPTVIAYNGSTGSALNVLANIFTFF